MPVGNGGVIGPANIPTTSIARGVWSLKEAFLAQKQGIWPVPTYADPYFEYTTLLLPGNGTNGAQNNTFLDASTNNFTITRNGNTTQGTFSPFSQTGWGNYFDGSGDYLSVPDSALFTMGSGNFTIECWVFRATAGSRTFIFGQSNGSSDAATSVVAEVTSANKLRSSVAIGNSPYEALSTNNFPQNQWVHVAVVREGGSLKQYINGSLDGQNTSLSTSSINDSSEIFGVGSLGSYSGLWWNGYISNFRVTKGGALYTSAFTPSTTPLTTTVSAGTVSLLTCQSNRFIDNSTNNLTITRNGDTRVVAFSPFNPSASWSAATYGGSGYFDGSGDYLSVADNANLRFGTSAFTIQAWIYRNASGTAHSIIAKGGASTGYVLQVTSTNVLRFTHGTTNVDTTTTIPASAWTHVAAVRTNTSTNGFQLYINGVSSATATVSTDFNQTDTLYIGADRGAANVMNGYISGLKYTNGTAESISVPTEPPTSTTNVVLLLNFTNAGIYDATSKNDLETVGNAQISNTTAQFGSTSIKLTDSGAYCKGSPNVLLDINGGDFTIEFWVRFDSLSGDRALISKYGNSNENNGGVGYLVQWVQSTSVLRLVLGLGGTTDALYTWSWSPSISTWYHIAITRNGTSGRAFINGTQIGSTLTLSVSDVASPNSIQVGKTHTVSQYTFGYMQDVRVTKGYARYTSNFTAPTAAFPTL